jgi:hypothetical protein
MIINEIGFENREIFFKILANNMISFKDAKIYKIHCNKTGLNYIGSTCEPTLEKRLSKHKSQYQCYLNGKTRFVTCYDILKNNDYSISLVENVNAKNNDELLARETYYIKNTKNINKYTPSLDEQQYKITNGNKFNPSIRQ